MRLLLFIGVLFVFSSAKAYTVPSHYMSFAYERGTSPDDSGETVLTPGKLVSSINTANRAIYTLKFVEKSEDFSRLGGWMVPVVNVVVDVPLIPENERYSETFYGTTKGTAVLSKIDQATETVPVTCLQSKAKDARIINCYFNGFDSVTATIPQ